MGFDQSLQAAMQEKDMGISAVSRVCKLSGSTVRGIISRKQKDVALNAALTFRRTESFLGTPPWTVGKDA